MRVLPNFLVIGAQRSATTSLCSLLRAHPQVFISWPKEPFFFSHDEVWRQGLEWYEQLFEDGRSREAVGEGSTTYTMRTKYPDTARRIAEHLPDAKLIYIVRNPVDRIVSAWRYLRAKGRELDPFPVAVRRTDRYLDVSRYLYQLEPYRSYHGDESILVLFFDDFTNDPVKTTREVCGFLGVDPTASFDPSTMKKNESAKVAMDTVLLRLIRRIPGFRSMRKLIPSSAGLRLRSRLKTTLDDPEELEETKNWLWAELRSETERFLIEYGRPVHYWR